MVPGDSLPGETGVFQIGSTYAYYGYQAITYLDYMDLERGGALTAIPGNSYKMMVCSGRPGLSVPPQDGRWAPGGIVVWGALMPRVAGLHETRVLIEQARIAHGHYSEPGGCKVCMAGEKKDR